MELFLILLIVGIGFIVPKLVDAHLLRLKVRRVALAAKERAHLVREMWAHRKERRRK